jgi:large subunit ribosomal protein L5
MQRLKAFYFTNVIPILQEKFSYSNVNEIPKLKKIIINRGFDESCQNAKILDTFSNEISVISGQKPVIALSKNSIAGFKVKERMPVGMFVTLRGEKMYSFLDRLVNLVFPRIRDFRGFSKTNFDGNGNYSLGLDEQLIFPEIDFDQVIRSQGMDITIVTTTKSDEQSFSLLKELGFPFSL